MVLAGTFEEGNKSDEFEYLPQPPQVPSSLGLPSRCTRIFTSISNFHFPPDKLQQVSKSFQRTEKLELVSSFCCNLTECLEREFF
jgi:hypothetical protein